MTRNVADYVASAGLAPVGPDDPRNGPQDMSTSLGFRYAVTVFRRWAWSTPDGRRAFLFAAVDDVDATDPAKVDAAFRSDGCRKWVEPAREGGAP